MNEEGRKKKRIKKEEEEEEKGKRQTFPSMNPLYTEPKDPFPISAPLIHFKRTPRATEGSRAPGASRPLGLRARTAADMFFLFFDSYSQKPAKPKKEILEIFVLFLLLV